MASLRLQWMRSLLAVLLLSPWAVPASAQGAGARVPVVPAARLPAGFAERRATVDGVTLNYAIGGRGPLVILLHGYTQTSHMWTPLLPLLAGTHTVIAPDLRGAGGSERTAGGYDKKTLATDVRGLVRQLGYTGPVQVVGHDIGLMVAYAYAAQYPTEVSKLVLMDAFLPGIGEWTNVWLLRDLWHFHFYGETPEALVKGRERVYFDHFWNDFAADRTHSVPEADRQLYSAAYARAGGVHAGFQYFQTFEQDAKDFAKFGQTRLKMPLLVLTGEKASGEFLIQQGRLVADTVEGVVIKGSGHWLMEEAGDQVMPRLVSFLAGGGGQAGDGRRLTPAEIADLARGGAGVGTSGVAGIQTSILSGDPTKPGLYTIRLSAPPRTRIEAHMHRDDRAATVVSGTWYFGYGSQFDSAALKTLPAGSFYTESPNQPHFAETRDEPIVVHITGYGPSDTTYVKVP